MSRYLIHHGITDDRTVEEYLTTYSHISLKNWRKLAKNDPLFESNALIVDSIMDKKMKDLSESELSSVRSLAKRVNSAYTTNEIKSHYKKSSKAGMPTNVKHSGIGYEVTYYG